LAVPATCSGPYPGGSRGGSLTAGPPEYPVAGDVTGGGDC